MPRALLVRRVCVFAISRTFIHDDLSGEIFDKVLAIPLYMSIKVAIATGVIPASGGMDEWVLLQAIHDEKSKYFNYDGVTTNSGNY